VDRAPAGGEVAEVAPEIGVQALIGVEAEERADDLDGIVKLTNLTLNSPPEEVCQRRRSSGNFSTIDFIR
jgi:hypothetical protein